MVLCVYRVDCYPHSVCSGFLRTFINAWHTSSALLFYYALGELESVIKHKY